MKKSKGLVNGLVVLQMFIGLGAVGGGLLLILKPSGAILGLPLDMLRNSPFSNYLVPGIVLLLVNGLGSLVGAAASFRRYRYAGETAVALGAFLAAWIIFQVYWIADFHWIHASYLSLGILEVILGLLLRKALRKELG